MNVVAIVQARMGSTRLPGKVLADIEGATMLERVLARLRRARSVDEVVVATTAKPEDEPIARLCARLGVPVFRGDEHDVLDRYHGAARAHAADLVVRVTSDCPLLSPRVVDAVVRRARDAPDRPDYASNTLPPRTFPRGLDVEAVAFPALDRAWREDADPAWREHVTPYLYRHPEKFRLAGVVSDVDHSAHRWTVDTPEDLALARRVYAHFAGRDFEWDDVLRALDAHPEWSALNRAVAQKEVP